jgi:hypothetical protein
VLTGFASQLTCRSGSGSSSPLERPDDTRQSTGIDVLADDHAQAIRQRDLNPSLSNS